MLRCAIYGAGSLGTVLGAFMTKNGADVTLINRNREHVDALNKNGATITGKLKMNQPVKAILPQMMDGKYDVIILLTKQLYNKEVVEHLKNFLADDGVLVTLQNGLPEPQIAEILGKNRTMGCTVEWGASMTEPGVCELTSEPDSLSFHMGRMEGISDEQFNKVKGLLELMCPVHEEKNLIGARWSKLLINATFSGLGTVMGGVFGDVCDSSKAREVAVRLMKEVIDVGTAANVEFAPVQGKQITKLFYYKSPIKKFIAKSLIPIAMKKHRSIEPSMLQDLKKGKPTEIDAINGVVCEWGKKVGVATPINDKVVEIVKMCEKGIITPAKENINMFDSLIK